MALKSARNRLHPRLVCVLLGAIVVLAACSTGNKHLPGEDLLQVGAGGEWEAAVREELDGRSFRQFQPHKDGNPRKGVILDFSSGISLWAQYAQDSHAVNEWEIRAESYSIDGQDGDTAFTIYFDSPTTSQGFPTPCDGCIETEQFSISIRNVFSKENVAFRLNDPKRMLPEPFPVFGSWTKFIEDEYFD